MTLTRGSIPKQRITVTHLGEDIEFQSETLQCEVILRENAPRICVLTANDYQSKTFLGQCDIANNLKVEMKYVDGDNTYTQVFGGWINSLQPNKSGTETVGTIAYGYGIALNNMLVRNEYGNETDLPTLDTIYEILTDAENGIIPKYVNKVLATATDSGYTIDTTKVANVTSDFDFVSFRGEPANKCLEDMINLIRAANVPNAGAHWIVVPSGTTAYLCLATVGAHENPPADVWPTYFNYSQADSTIVVNEDMILNTFKKQRAEANYILLTGDWMRPTGEVWTATGSALWDDSNNAATTISDDSDAGDYVVGVDSIQIAVAAP